jgi:hypothetical protein
VRGERNHPGGRLSEKPVDGIGYERSAGPGPTKSPRQDDLPIWECFFLLKYKSVPRGGHRADSQTDRRYFGGMGKLPSQISGERADLFVRLSDAVASSTRFLTKSPQGGFYEQRLNTPQAHSSASTSQGRHRLAKIAA